MKRMQFELTDEKYERLMVLMKVCGIETQKDLFQNALGMFEWAVNERKRGRIVASVDEERNRYKELSMPALDHVRAVAPS